ncbi:nuclear transport factor 2 family protein [Streptomyces odontomachi]|uniref:nuclear transport factor 2 family protein n=1 Tax=Streptomyces odontomachi TaxID=2944940 RepID=UPI00210D25CB|nr:nuclear transport factor 2 family protein [Streptomyces sp. ODS25]
MSDTTGGRTACQTWLAYNAAENARDLAAMAALVAAELRATVNGRPAVSSAEDDAAAMDRLLCTYPDYRREVVEVIDAGERGTVRWRMTGRPAPGSGVAPLDVAGCSVLTARGGRIVEAHLYHDGTGLHEIVTAPPGEARR